MESVIGPTEINSKVVAGSKHPQSIYPSHVEFICLHRPSWTPAAVHPAFSVQVQRSTKFSPNVVHHCFPVSVGPQWLHRRSRLNLQLRLIYK